MGINRPLGWFLLVASFAGAVALDPWSLSERDPSVLVGNRRMFARHAQAVLVGMAFLQLTVAKLLEKRSPSAVGRWAAGLAAGGAVLYCVGYVLYILWPAGAWLSVVGAVLNFLAFAALVGTRGPKHETWTGEVVPLVFCFGMLIDAVMGVFVAEPDQLLPAYIGPEDGVRLRMLRLARAAVIALSLLTLLYQDLANQGDGKSRWVRWGNTLLAVGAVGMPLILALAAFTWLDLKFLLGIPAMATFTGTLAGVWLAGSVKRPLEVWGWLLIASGMAAGLLMGLYAFDGPFPTPDFLGAYNDFHRRLSRLAHAYAIVLGLVSIFLARQLHDGPLVPSLCRLGIVLFVAGSIAMVAGVLFQAVVFFPLAMLCIGPACVALGVVLCLLRPRQ